MTPEWRVQAMRAGHLSLGQCLAWAAQAGHEVPLVNGEFEFLALATADAEMAA